MKTGTGKELVARSIHKRSPRSTARFMPVDCGAIPGESGGERIFLGTNGGRLLARMSGGWGCSKWRTADTALSGRDHVACPSPCRPSFCASLQERRFRRVGGKDEIAVNIRVVAAASRDLASEIRTQRFREDLYYRLNVGYIMIPPLRERVEDIPLLVAYFVDRYRQEMRKPAIELKPEVMEVLMAVLLAGKRPRAAECPQAGAADEPGSDTVAARPL